MNRILKATEQNFHNNPIPPRSRAYCCADSPRRGEYGSLATPQGLTEGRKSSMRKIGYINK